MMKNASKELRKIVLHLPPDAWHGHATETIWAEKVGEEQFRIRSVPFFATGLSVEDIVRVREEDEMQVAIGVEMHFGHSTYRLFLTEGVEIDSPAFSDHWGMLERLGCSYERATKRLFAVDVPPHADIHEVFRLLENGESAGVWDFEEGHCGHI